MSGHTRTTNHLANMFAGGLSLRPPPELRCYCALCDCACLDLVAPPLGGCARRVQSTLVDWQDSPAVFGDQQEIPCLNLAR
jgi:hypothetical protein